ncbi:MAG TPA: NUDIX domain-containing protein [Candidatus Nanoarchaeia archaeon]|nr:NUDIX domain-containing protein [Candidatus Nanoarchaeia archaeon]
MQIKKGVVGIVFDMKNDKFFFLILHRPMIWSGWEFPKGIINSGELPEEALAREIQEETGLLKIKIIKKLDQKREFLHKGFHYVFEIFIVQASRDDVVDISQEITEHDDYAWLEADEAIAKLYWPDERRNGEKALGEIRKSVQK